MKKFDSIAAVFAAAGKDENDYQVLPISPASVNAAICADRLRIIAKAYNGDRKVDLTDTSQWKHTPVHRIIPDEKARFGFRLSFGGCDCANVGSVLGARPPFDSESDAIEAGQEHIEEFEQWYYWQNKAYQEL